MHGRVRSRSASGSRSARSRSTCSVRRTVYRGTRSDPNNSSLVLRATVDGEFGSSCRAMPRSKPSRPLLAAGADVQRRRAEGPASRQRLLRPTSSRAVGACSAAVISVGAAQRLRSAGSPMLLRRIAQQRCGVIGAASPTGRRSVAVVTLTASPVEVVHAATADVARERLCRRTVGRSRRSGRRPGPVPR